MAAANLQQQSPANDGAPSGKVFTAHHFVDGNRFKLLNARESYYNCTQHDLKQIDFDGRAIGEGGVQKGIGYTQPLLSNEKFPYFVPLRARRPSAPYRLGRAMVNAFTNHVFGESRFPNFSVRGDEDSEDWVKTCSKVGNLPMKMIRARNIGGSMGTVGMSWAFVDGRPRYKVHNGKNLFVHAWEDREELIPSHVTECFQFSQEEFDPEQKKVIDVYYWQRRDWTDKMELVFKPAIVDPNNEPQWVIDLQKTVVHNDNDTHFVWIQNLPSEQVDGLPDYEGQFEALDELDLLISVIVKGAKLNLDPTLVLKEDRLFAAAMGGVKKGSEWALTVDKDGDAKYLELAGTSIESGIKLVNEVRRMILEVGECVIPDPDQIAAQGQSAAAQKMVFSRMLAKGGTLQEQYGEGLRRLNEPVLFISQQRIQVPVTIQDEDGNDTDEQADQEFDLPDRVDQDPELGDDGQPTGKQLPRSTPRHPGEGTDIEVEWPPRFPPTATDQQALVTSLSTAVAAKPVLSQQTATELVAEAFGREGTGEWQKVQTDQKQQDQKEQQMQQGVGGQIDPMQHAGPPGGAGGTPKPPGGGKPPKPGGGGGAAGSGGGDKELDGDRPPAGPP